MCNLEEGPPFGGEDRAPILAHQALAPMSFACGKMALLHHKRVIAHCDRTHVGRITCAFSSMSD